VPHLSVVIPTFNEALRIERTLREVDGYLRRAGYAYELLVVDNGSRDGTAELVERLAESFDSLRLISERGAGKGSAVRAGVRQSLGEFVLFMDADHATPISEIERFWPLWGGAADVLIGSRWLETSIIGVPQPRRRRILSRIGNRIVRALLVPGVADTQTGFKGFRGAVGRELFADLRALGWAFDVELLVLARLRGYRIVEVGVRWSDQAGTHLSAGAYAGALLEVLQIRWRLWRHAYRRGGAR